MVSLVEGSSLMEDRAVCRWLELTLEDFAQISWQLTHRGWGLVVHFGLQLLIESVRKTVG